MILSDKTIKRMIGEGLLIENPIDIEKSVQPASYDLTLSDNFLVSINNTVDGKIDLKDKVLYDKLFVETDEDGSKYIIVPSKSFVLISTNEIVKLPNNITAFVKGRSSIGRAGLVLQNGPLVDSGYRGTLALSYYNISNFDIKLYVGMRIGQIVFYYNDSTSDNPYNGKYQNSTGTTGSRIDKDFE